jgi:transposase
MSQRRYEITDFEWSIIAPLLPDKPRGVPRVNDRRVLNGIFWRLRSGSPWADIPSATARRRPATIALSAGGSSECGTGSSIRFRAPMTATFRWSIARRSGFISTPPT